MNDLMKKKKKPGKKSSCAKNKFRPAILYNFQGQYSHRIQEKKCSNVVYQMGLIIPSLQSAMKI